MAALQAQTAMLAVPEVEAHQGHRLTEPEAMPIIFLRDRDMMAKTVITMEQLATMQPAVEVVLLRPVVMLHQMMPAMEEPDQTIAPHSALA